MLGDVTWSSDSRKARITPETIPLTPPPSMLRIVMRLPWAGGLILREDDVDDVVAAEGDAGSVENDVISAMNDSKELYFVPGVLEKRVFPKVCERDWMGWFHQPGKFIYIDKIPPAVIRKNDEQSCMFFIYTCSTKPIQLYIIFISYLLKINLKNIFSFQITFI